MANTIEHVHYVCVGRGRWQRWATDEFGFWHRTHNLRTSQAWVEDLDAAVAKATTWLGRIKTLLMWADCVVSARKRISC